PLFGEDFLNFKTTKLTIPKIPNPAALTVPAGDKAKGGFKEITALLGEDRDLAPGGRDDPLKGIKLKAVYTAPLTFIVTEDGVRLFRGAVLPSGYVLEDITTKSLTLRRGNKVTTYRLRGNYE
ncbi:MAG: hypothetical protein IJU40_03780, partial [Desulfovibrionaceae bacterium]|nr:hypothetical protein [Desulfovibrionaceae bacterium]